MRKKTFTQGDIERLLNNTYVKSVSQKGITYSDEFKRILL